MNYFNGKLLCVSRALESYGQTHGFGLTYELFIFYFVIQPSLLHFLFDLSTNRKHNNKKILQWINKQERKGNCKVQYRRWLLIDSSFLVRISESLSDSRRDAFDGEFFYLFRNNHSLQRLTNRQQSSTNFRCIDLVLGPLQFDSRPQAQARLRPCSILKDYRTTVR